MSGKMMEEANRVNFWVDVILQEKRNHKSAFEIADETIRAMPAQVITTKILSWIGLSELKEWWYNLGLAKISVLAGGWVKIMRWEDASGQEPRPIPQKIYGIYSALRMLDKHILRQYKMIRPRGEIAKLEHYADVINQANLLLTNWGGASDNERRDIQHKLIELVLQLESCRNPHKKNIGKEVETVAQYQDARGRINPSAMAAKTVNALGQLAFRFEELHIIIPKMALKKELLTLEERRMSAAVKRAKTEISFMLKHRAFSGKSYQEPELAIMAERMNFVRKNLKGNLITPFREQSSQGRYYLEQAKGKLLKGDLVQTKKLLETVLNILKMDLKQFDPISQEVKHEAASADRDASVPTCD